jgi:hypothetical protein
VLDAPLRPVVFAGSAVGRIAYALGLVLAGLMVAAAPARAQTAPGFAREGVYVGVGGIPATTLDDASLVGDVYFEADDDGELFVLPSLDSQPLLRAVVGFRSRPLALEFSYDRARHAGEFLDLPRDTIFQAINVDGRFFFATDHRVQPHAVVGMAFPWMTVKDGSFEPGSDFTGAPQGDATFRGPGLNTEVGVTVFATPRVGVSVGYIYRVIWFRRVRGVGDESKDLRPPFYATRGHVMVAGFVTF